MNILHSSFRTLFARDMVIKMNYGSCLDLAKIKKATLQYTSKYVVEEPKQSFLACVAFQLITQQTPRIIHAKQSVAAFKLKEHQVVGCIVTLRRDNMYEFLQNVIYTHLPQNTYFTPIQVSKIQSNVHFGLSQVLFFSELETCEACALGSSIVSSSVCLNVVVTIKKISKRKTTSIKGVKLIFTSSIF